MSSQVLQSHGRRWGVGVGATERLTTVSAGLTSPFYSPTIASQLLLISFASGGGGQDQQGR